MSRSHNMPVHIRVRIIPQCKEVWNWILIEVCLGRVLYSIVLAHDVT